MNIAFILFNGITWLDLIGVYDPIARLRSMNLIKDIRWDFCSLSKTTSDNFGLQMHPNHIAPDLQYYDAVIIPGGQGTRILRFDVSFLDWIGTAEAVKYKVSVCTGSLIWGGAGMLYDKFATTHYQEYKTLEPYCKQVLSHRIVDDRNTITAGAVSSSLDLGIYLCEKWAGITAREEIIRKMNYTGYRQGHKEIFSF
jgi:transcriptional regulator GlxA family with amidase domain